MDVRIGCVVEGHGEREALGVLLRRVANEVTPEARIVSPKPIRIPRSKLVRDGELERAAKLAARTAGDGSGVLVLLDSDEDCPATLGPGLLSRLQTTLPGIPSAVVLAKTEFESWFIAAAESIAGRRGLVPDLASPADPEAIRDAKGWLRARMTGSHGYSETVDQAALAAVFDLAAARRALSFDKFIRDVSRLLAELSRPGTR